MKPKITYILGAGASFGTLPLVKDFANRVRFTMRKISSKIPEFNGDLNPQQVSTLTEIIKELEALVKNAGTHHTIDTYAKNLYLKGDITNLNKLKIILSVYFTIEQSYNSVGNRYSAFLASILDKLNSKLLLPDNVKILSWNYDYQMELAFSNFKETSSAEELDAIINVYPRKGVSNYMHGFSLFKLNGTACSFVDAKGFFERNLLKADYNLRDSHDGSILKDIKQEDELNLFKRIVEYYSIYKTSSKPSLHFAWEDEPIPTDVRAKAKAATKDSEILVVIGYSFPVYNRLIDRDLINNMENLKKIYFQIPKGDEIEGVIQRFKAIRPLQKTEFVQELEIEQIPNTTEFFIPFEF